jgi:hypothetical protein
MKRFDDSSHYLTGGIYEWNTLRRSGNKLQKDTSSMS